MGKGNARQTLVTQAAYARHRAERGLPGGTKKSVTVAVQEGRISLINGLIDPAVADIQWANNTRSRVTHSTGSTGGHVSTPDDDEAMDDVPPAAVEPPPSVSPERTDYFQSRSHLAKVQLESASLELAEKKGELIRVTAVKSVLAAAFTSMREGLMQLPARLAAPLAAETDPARIQSLLEEAVHAALTHVAKLPERIDPGKAVEP